MNPEESDSLFKADGPDEAKETRASAEDVEMFDDDDDVDDDDEDDEEGKVCEPYVPIKYEDFGPGEEYMRDLFFAFRAQHDEEQAKYHAELEAEEAANKEKDSKNPPPDSHA